MSVSVKESSGIVVVNQIQSRAVAAHICSRFRGVGVPACVGMFPGSATYQVTVPQLDALEVERILRELRIEPRRQ